MTEENQSELTGSLKKAVNNSRILAVLFSVAVLIYIFVSLGQVLFAGYSMPRLFEPATVDDMYVSLVVILSACALALSPGLSGLVARKTAATSADEGRIYFKSYLTRIGLRTLAVLLGLLAYTLTSDISFCLSLGLIAIAFVLYDFPSNTRARALVSSAAKT